MTRNRSTSKRPIASRAGRPRNAAASMQALLQSAQTLFGQKGFADTTTREIGELAGVDAALIARYFGSKGALYVAAVAAEDLGDQGPAEYEGLEQMVDVVIGRAIGRGPGPIVQALVRSDTSSEIREAAQERITHRLVDPLVATMAESRVDRPRLRAEITVAALLGISLCRSLGWFEEICDLDKDELARLVVDALREFTKEDHGNSP